jgi:hypothetical protein
MEIYKSQMHLPILTMIFSLSLTTHASYNVKKYNFIFISSNEGKITMQSTHFSCSTASLVQCIQRCTTTQGCISLFFSANSICQGHGEVFEAHSPSLVSKPGVAYYVFKDHAGLSNVLCIHYP